jgi:hypothetical protein
LQHLLLLCHLGLREADRARVIAVEELDLFGRNDFAQAPNADRRLAFVITRNEHQLLAEDLPLFLDRQGSALTDELAGVPVGTCRWCNHPESNSVRGNSWAQQEWPDRSAHHAASARLQEIPPRQVGFHYSIPPILSAASFGPRCSSVSLIP